MDITEVVNGTIKGMGWQAECALLLSRCDRDLRATRCTVLHAPEWLPDGYYEATFREQSAFLHRSHGAWSVGIPWTVLPARPKPEAVTETFVAEWMRTLAS